MRENRSPDISAIVELAWNMEGNVSLTNCVEAGLTAQGFKIDELSLLSRFDRIKSATARKIEAKISQCDESGLTPRFRFSEIDSDELVFQPASLPESSRKEAVQAVVSLPWRTFERLCRLALEISGVKKSHVMRGTKEGGVDVFGVLDPSAYLHPAIWKGSEIRVFCQVKKGRIGEPAARLFNGDLQDLCVDKGRAFGLLPLELRRAKSAVLGGMFSAQGFTKDAERYSKSHGFFAVDAKRLVEVLLNCGRDVPGFVSGRKLKVHVGRLGEYLMHETGE